MRSNVEQQFEAHFVFHALGPSDEGQRSTAAKNATAKLMMYTNIDAPTALSTGSPGPGSRTGR